MFRCDYGGVARAKLVSNKRSQFLGSSSNAIRTSSGSGDKKIGLGYAYAVRR
jgi:hypothetical protein